QAPRAGRGRPGLADHSPGCGGDGLRRRGQGPIPGGPDLRGRGLRHLPASHPAAPAHSHPRPSGDGGIRDGPRQRPAPAGPARPARERLPLAQGLPPPLGEPLGNGADDPLCGPPGLPPRGRDPGERSRRRALHAGVRLLLPAGGSALVSAASLPLGMRRVLVTGASSGIGRAVAEALLARGAQVALVGRRRDRLEEIAAAAAGRTAVLVADLARPGEADGLCARARDLLGGLDGLVCAAGVVHHQRPGAIEEGALREQLEVNLVAPLRLGEEALSVLEPGGAVVYVASNLAHRPIETSAVYSATKAGLLAAMRALAIAGARCDVRFNAVSPGIVDTEMVRKLRLTPGESVPEGVAYERRGQGQLEGLPALGAL